MGKNYVESSLKRFLKRKVKITMGFVVAFMITGTVGFAEVITEPIDKGNELYQETIRDDVSINTVLPIGIQLNSKDIINNHHNLEVESNNISIRLESNNSNKSGARGINTINGSKLFLGKKNTEKVEINVKNTGLAIGIANIGHDNNQNLGAETVVNGEELKITVNSTEGAGFGVISQNNTSNPLNKVDVTKVAKIKLNSENIIMDISTKKGNALGILCFSNSHIDVNGNLTINTKSEKGLTIAIDSRGNSILNINQNKDKKVILNGDIYFEHQGDSDNEKDTRINLNLSTKDSVLNGKIYRPTKYSDLEYSENNGMLLSLSNEAQWNNTGDSFVTDLTLDNGIINNNSIDNDIKVKTLKGTGGAVNMAAAIDEKTGKATSGALNINTIDDKTKLNINYSGSENLEVDKEKAEEVFNQLAGNIKVENGKLNATAKLEEGFVSREYVSELVKDEKGNIVVKEDSVKVGNLNSMVEGIRDLATINLLTWRQEMNSLNKRMGELRNSTGEHGVWSRVYTGKIENGSKYDNDYQTYQVGYDKKYTVDNGVMFVGGLVSYTDGETDYALGHGENYSVGAGIYATWLNNDGQFADVVLKQSRLHNKFDVTSKNGNKSQSGDYNNWGTSLSGQYGRRFDLNDKFFLEPSVELTLGRVDDTTYTTSAGVDVHQDTMYSLVGNVGTSVGYKFSDKGNVYARAALVKEFQGDIDTEYEKDGALERTSEDLGDTWAEFGVGVNYRFVENMNVYIDVQKTGEATVDNKWQANLGFRYEF